MREVYPHFFWGGKNMVVRIWDNMLVKGDQMTPNDFFSFREFLDFFGREVFVFLVAKL